MLDMKFDHIGLAEISRHRNYLQEEDRIPQRFRGHFMIQQLESITACNQHDHFIGPFQYGGTASLSTGNLTGRKTPSRRDPSGIGRRIWQKFRGQGNTYLRISTFYMPVPLAQGGSPGSVYSQNLTSFNTNKRRT